MLESNFTISLLVSVAVFRLVVNTVALSQPQL